MEETKKKIRELMADLKCCKDFKCVNSGFQQLCKGKDIGVQRHLVCLEENPEKCKFSSKYDPIHLCKCPLRIYIAKTLKK